MAASMTRRYRGKWASGGRPTGHGSCRLDHPVSTARCSPVHRMPAGGLSLVLPHAPSLTWDLGDTRGTVMLRMPLHPVALELLREVGPMAVSSANRSGLAPAITVDQAREQLADRVSVFLDGGRAGE